MAPRMRRRLMSLRVPPGIALQPSRICPSPSSTSLRPLAIFSSNPVFQCSSVSVEARLPHRQCLSSISDALTGLCAGKEVTAQCLIEQYGFQEIILRSSTERERPNTLYFGRVSELVDYVTKRWREHFVLTKVTNETVLDELAGRPFFILISVDAPVQVRWRRWKARYEARCHIAGSQETLISPSGSKPPINQFRRLSNSSTNPTMKCTTPIPESTASVTEPPSKSSTRMDPSTLSDAPLSP